MLYAPVSSGHCLQLSQTSVCSCVLTVCLYTSVYVSDIHSKVRLTGCANFQEVKRLFFFFLEGQKSSGGAHCGWKIA